LWPSLEKVLEVLIHPLLGITYFLELVLEAGLAHLKRFSFTAKRVDAFYRKGMDTHRPPHFDDTKFPYYSARMACYLDVVNLGVWRVTRDGMKPPKNPEKPTTSEEKEIHLNARAKNCLYESLSMNIFNQVFTLKTATEIWLKLHELHDGTSNVREQKHCLVLNEYNSFAMKDNELARDMYSCLNLIIIELNSIGINKLGDVDIVRKIISLLPQQRYESIITILHNMEDLSTMTPTIVIGRIAAFEMSQKCVGERSQLPQGHMLLHVMKGRVKRRLPLQVRQVKKREEEESDDDEDNQPSTSSSEDEETIRRIRKVIGMIHKINLMGVPLQVEDILFNIDRKKQKKERMLRMRGEGPLQGQLSNYGRTHKREEQRQGAYKC
jgi:hypothetical protein